MLEGPILVTGGAGFLGAHLVAALRARGAAEVVVPRSRDVDLRDPTATRALFEGVRPRHVFHLAATVGGIGLSRRHPAACIADNLAMGLAVLEAARAAAVAKLVLAGSVCAYPKHVPVPAREDDLWSGYPDESTAPFGIATRTLLALAQAYRAEHGLRAVTLLLVNLYGPGDDKGPERSHVVPALIGKLTGAGPVTLWGDGTPTRELLHVEDAAEAFVLAAERYDDPRPLNVGSGFAISIRELADRIAAAVGYRGEIRWDPTQPGGQPRRLVDSSRARAALGFAPRVDFDDGLARTIAWYSSRAFTERRSP